MAYLCPYIKGTNKKYGTDDNGGFWGENGFNCIEVGYLELSPDAKEVIQVTVLIDCADVISVGDYFDSMPEGTRIDCIGDGYLRFFHAKHDLKWRDEKIALSEMRLVVGKPRESDDARG